MTQVLDVLHLPPTLIAGMRFRSIEQNGVRMAAKFSGADVRLILVIWSAYAQMHWQRSQSHEVIIPQAILSHHLGKIHKDRLEKSITRLLASDVWDGERWIPILMDCGARPGTPVRPKVPVGDDYCFDIGPEMAAALRRGLNALPRPGAFKIDSAPLQQLESRHAVILYCRYKAWMSDYHAPPVGALGLDIFPSGIGMRVDVAGEDLGPVVFGYEGKLPPSIVHRLFVTEGQRPPVHLELRRADIDCLVTPVQSGARKGLSYDVTIGDMIRKTSNEKSMAALNDSLKMLEISRIRKRVPHRRKRGVLSNAT